MESTVVESDNHNNNNNNKNDNKLEQVDDSYEDDFEKDLDSEETKNVSSPRKSSASDDDQDIVAPPITITSPNGVEKGQLEVETPGKERPVDEPSDNDSEPDADAYNFTEDQRRAMMELMVQKQEDADLLDEEPPEYNVKGRIEQLNAELANDPTPVEGERELKVGFKAEIVDLVAPPPPDFSDDESQPNSARGTAQSSETATTSSSKGDSNVNNENNDNNKENVKDNNKKQYVIERDGVFSVLSANELTASERAMYVKDEPTVKSEKQNENQKSKDKSHSSNSDGKNNSNNSGTSQVVPRPPSRPRPNTAATGPRRNVRQAHSPRPKSAGQTSNNSGTLDNFDYNSPYAMTPEQKEEARDQAKRMEDERKQREKKRQEEEEERRRDNDTAFQAWLRQKKEERKNQGQQEGKQQTEQERMTKHSGSDSSQNESFDSYEVIYPYLLRKPPREENESAYKTWLKVKRQQGKKEKLLRRRQQQEQMEGYFIRQREECENAYREWLKKKNADLRKQQAMEKQRNKTYRIQVKRSKKTQALVKAMKEVQAFRYVDYYGYRY